MINYEGVGRNKFINLLKFLEKNNIDSDEFKLEWVLDIENSDEYIDDDEMVIKGSDVIGISLPCSENDWFEPSIAELIGIVDKAKEGRNLYDYKFVHSKQILYRVHAIDPVNIDKLTHHHGLKKISHSLTHNDKCYEVSLLSGLTPFGMRVVIDEAYGEYNPPVSDEYYVSIESEDKLEEKVTDEILNAYIFEIYTTANIELEIAPRVKESWWDYDYVNDDYKTLEFRPLKLGKGVNKLYQLFNSSISITNSEVKILFLSKVIEYVSQTVIKNELVNCMLNKLRTQKALAPDANFVMELEHIFKVNNNYTKDVERYKITIKTCCDIMSIKEIAPVYLKKLNELKIDSNTKEIENAQKELAIAISNTRNELAHAKPNYSPKGLECPSGYLDDFAAMLKIISEQVVRWYVDQSEISRID